MVDYKQLESAEKAVGQRKLITTVAELVGKKGKVDWDPANLARADKQKIMLVTGDNGKVYQFCCDARLSELIANHKIGATEVGPVEICEVALLTGADKGKLTIKACLPENWKETITVKAEELKTEVTPKKLYETNDVIAW